MNYIIIAFIVSFSAFASELRCSNNGSAIMYVNGFGNTPEDARDSHLEIKRIAIVNTRFLDKNSKGESKLYHTYQYNHTDGLITDLIEAFFQKFREKLPKSTNPFKVWSQYLRLYSFPDSIKDQDIIDQLKFDLDRVTEQLTELSPAAQDTIALSQLVGGYLAADKKVILVSHSQGGLFANEMYRVLLNNPLAVQKIKYYKNLMVATPANINLSGGHWMTNSSDAVIKAFGLAANYELPTSGDLVDYIAADPRMHGFLEIYTNPDLKAVFSGANSDLEFAPDGSMEQIFAGNLIESAKLLESNCTGLDLPQFSGKFTVSGIPVQGIGYSQNHSAIDNQNDIYYQLGSSYLGYPKLFKLNSLNGELLGTDLLDLPSGLSSVYKIEIGSDQKVYGLIKTSSGGVALFSMPVVPSGECLCDKAPVRICNEETGCVYEPSSCSQEELSCIKTIAPVILPGVKDLSNILYLAQQEKMVGFGEDFNGGQKFFSINLSDNYVSSLPIKANVPIDFIPDELHQRSDGKLIGLGYKLPAVSEQQFPTPGTEELTQSKIVEIDLNSQIIVGEGEDQVTYPAVSISLLRDLPGLWQPDTFDGSSSASLFAMDMLHIFGKDFYPYEGDFLYTTKLYTFDTACMNGQIVTNNSGDGEQCVPRDYVTTEEHGFGHRPPFSFHFNRNYDVVGLIQNSTGASFFKMGRTGVMIPSTPPRPSAPVAPLIP